MKNFGAEYENCKKALSTETVAEVVEQLSYAKEMSLREEREIVETASLCRRMAKRFNRALKNDKTGEDLAYYAKRINRWLEYAEDYKSRYADSKQWIKEVYAMLISVTLQNTKAA